MSPATPSLPASGLPAMLGNIRIKAKILSGFAFVLLLLGSLAGLSIWQIERIGDQTGRMIAISGNMARNLEVNHRLETMRQRSLRYKVLHDEAALKQFYEAQEEATELLSDAARLTLSDERRRAYNASNEGVTELRRQFDELAKVTKELKSAQSSLFAVGDELTATANAAIQAAVASGDASLVLAAREMDAALQAMRVANWRFQATNDPKGPATFKTNAERAIGAVEALDRRAPEALRAPLAKVRIAAKGYEENFNVYAPASLKSTELYEGQMRPKILELQTAAAKTKESLTADLKRTEAATEALSQSSERMALVLSLVSLVVGVALAWLIGRAIANPVVGMTAAMGKLAAGDKSVAIPGIGKGDEIGEMANAVQVFKENMIKAEEMEAAQRSEQAQKEARARTIEGYISTFDKSVASVLHMVSSSSTELQGTAQSMSSTAEETQRQATAVAAAAEQASSNVQTVASAAEELSSSIAEISRQVAESAKIAGRAVDEAVQTNAQIKGLAEAAQKIGDVVNLINDIASQTNLLALNATIEAARAGEAGKGFAVVASEVKSLATQTAKATEEISTKIAEMQGATTESVKAIDGISGTIGRINEIATTIASAVEEQGAATQEIARNVQQASKGTSEVSSNITGVTQAATDTGAAASQVLASSGELSKQSETLRSEVDGFLAKIRAA